MLSVSFGGIKLTGRWGVDAILNEGSAAMLLNLKRTLGFCLVLALAGCTALPRGAAVDNEILKAAQIDGQSCVDPLLALAKIVIKRERHYLRGE